MNHIDVPFEYNQMLERFSANGALMRTFTHVVNWKEIKIDKTMVYLTKTQLKNKISTYLGHDVPLRFFDRNENH